MSFKLKIIGGVMALAGLALSGFGWPYRMLDWGSMQVMLGAVLAMGGMLLAALGFAMHEVHAHIERLLLAAGRTQPEVTTAAVSEPADKSTGPSVTNSAPEPAAATAPAAGVGTAGLAAAAAAGAAVIAGAAAATGRPDEAKDALPETEPGFPPAGGLPKFDLDSFADEALARIAPVRDVAGSPIDELTAKINEAVGDIDLLRKGASSRQDPEPVIEVVAEPDPAPQPEEAEASNLPDPAEPVPVGHEPEPEQHRADEAESALSEPEAPEQPLALDQDEMADDAEPEAEQGAEKDAPEEAAPAAPVTSAEGIVGVHKVGASTFTMYADGTIRAETPEGAFGFNSVAELKIYLAGDRSVARPL